MVDLLRTATAFCVVCLSILGCVALGRFWRDGPTAIRERRRANLDAWETAHDRHVANRLLSDPNSPKYEAARHRVDKVLRAMGREDARAGFIDMANDLLTGDLMQMPTWIALGIMAKTDATEGDTAARDEAVVRDAVAALRDECNATIRYINQGRGTQTPGFDRINRLLKRCDVVFAASAPAAKAHTQFLDGKDENGCHRN